MKIYYRISSSGYNKIKPNYINKYNCLTNCIKEFGDLTIVADNCDSSLRDYLKQYKDVIYINRGNSGSFLFIVNKALELNDDEIVYFVEDDYLHRPNSKNVMLEAFTLGVDYVSLYDHPDKYGQCISPNPLVVGMGEDTQVYLTDSCHWKLTNATTYTFASKVKTLKEDYDLMFPFMSIPKDFEMWLALRAKGRSLVTPLPSYSTHGETSWLAPLTNWESI